MKLLFLWMLLFVSVCLLLCIYLHVSMVCICICLCLHVGEAMAPHSSTLVWKIPWMEESGRLRSMGSLRVGHD